MKYYYQYFVIYFYKYTAQDNIIYKQTLKPTKYKDFSIHDTEESWFFSKLQEGTINLSSNK